MIDEVAVKARAETLLTELKELGLICAILTFDTPDSDKQFVVGVGTRDNMLTTSVNCINALAAGMYDALERDTVRYAVLRKHITGVNPRMSVSLRDNHEWSRVSDLNATLDALTP